VPVAWKESSTKGFYRFSDHLMFFSAQRLDLFASCVRLSQLLIT